MSLCCDTHVKLAQLVLRILHLAASTVERPVEDALIVLLDAGDAISFDAVRERVAPNRPSVPLIETPAPDCPGTTD